MTEEAVKLPARCLLRSVTSAPSAACRSRECGYLGFPASSLSICWITVGGIGEKRRTSTGRLPRADYLSLTVSFDHNMLDACPRRAVHRAAEGADRERLGPAPRCVGDS